MTSRMRGVVEVLGAALLLAVAAMIPAAHADWMPLTGAESAPNIAEITVLDDRVRVVLEIYVGDIGTFEALVPDQWLKEPGTARPSQSERLRNFATQTLRIITDDGMTLPAELRLVEPRLRRDRYAPFAGMLDPATRQQIPGPPEDKRVLYAELDYRFVGKPKHLTIVPPHDALGKPTATIGFIAYHQAVPIIDFRFLTRGERLTLDWNDPWYTAFDNRNLTRHHKSALMTFLYVEPREVRHEMLIRVRELQEWVDLDLRRGEMLDSADQTRIRDRARSFFAERNPLSIDSRAVTPAAIRVEFLEISLTGLTIIEDARPLDPATAMLGVALSYPVEHLPGEVVVQWELFGERVTQIPATAIDPAGPFPSIIDAGDPTFRWHNLLRAYAEPQVESVVIDDAHSIRVPVLSVLLLALAALAAALAIRAVPASRTRWIAGAALSTVAALSLLRVGVVDVANPFVAAPDAETAAAVLSRVLTNVNHAYVEKDPDALRRALSVVVAAESLTDVKAELDRALAIRITGGGIARVDSVDGLAFKEVTALEGRSGFRGLAEWTAKASANHWGHLHQRVIRYRALVELVDEGGAWKLAGITVTDARQET